MSTVTQAEAKRQIRRATQALTNLAGREGGVALAAQLAGLVAVVAETASQGGDFQAGLVGALAAGVAPSAPAARTPEAPAPASGAEAAPAASGSADLDAVRAHLADLTVPQLRAYIRDRSIPVAGSISKLRKAELADIIVAASVSATTPDGPVREPAPAASGTPEPSGRSAKRKREPSPFDPYAVARQGGGSELRTRLAEFDIEQLKDVIHEYGMDYDRRAMSWSDTGRLVGRIIERAEFGITQGSAFRSDGGG